MSYPAKVMASDERSHNDLVHTYQKYVQSIAAKLISKMHLPATQMDDFISAGNLGLVEAAQRFNPESGVDFRSFAFLRIRGAIIDSIRANSELSGRAYKLSKAWLATQEMEERFLFDGLGKNVDADTQLAEVLEFAASGALAFKLSISEVEEEVAEVASDDLSQENSLIEQEKTRGLRGLIDKLPEKERIVILGYYFENKSFSEIVRCNDGLTKSWVSRLHVKALGRLKELILEHKEAIL